MNNSYTPNEITNILSIVLVFMISLFAVLLLVYFFLIMKNKKQENRKEKIIKKDIVQNKTQTNKELVKTNKQYTKQPIEKFIEFDTIVDNMIEQKNGQKYLMVVQCQGVNYDLMSGIEKTSVERGFIEFLNTLRHPIQIYVQTRKVDLGKSISTYQERLAGIEDEYAKQRMQYNSMLESGRYNQQQLESAWYELTKQSNLLEYGRDVIRNTEKMNLNQNVLKKEYYIIIPYYVAELGSNDYDKEELRSMAFSELYTKAQSIINTLLSCSVSGKILNSTELVDLLYVAYNRDESEVFGIERALQAQYDEMFLTAPDVLDKKMKELDKEIERQAIIIADEKLQEVKSEKEQQIQEKEENIQELAKRMAKIILQNNQSIVGKEKTNKAIQKIDNELGEKEGEENVQKEKAKRGRKPKKSE